MNKQTMGSKEWDDKLERVLRSGRSRTGIEASPNFESRFWQKVLAREKESWLIRVFKDLDVLIPVPSSSQIFAVVMIAFLIGGTGGFVSAFTSLKAANDPQAQMKSLQYLSGFQKFDTSSSSLLRKSIVTQEEEKIR